MQNGAVMLRKIPEAAEALKLSPGRSIGMTIGPQVVQLQPAAIATAVMGTKVHRSIHGTRAAVRGGHRIGPDRRRWMGGPGLLCTQRTVRLVRQALERCGLSGTLGLGLDGWAGGVGGVVLRPGQLRCNMMK